MGRVGDVTVRICNYPPNILTVRVHGDAGHARKGRNSMVLDPINILVWIIVGAIAGWLASIVMKTNASQGLMTDIIVGIVGGLIGGFVLNLIGVGGAVTGLNLGSILVAFIGAIILLALLRMLRRA